MKTYSKRFLAFFLSIFLIIAPTIQQANAASAWSVTNAVSVGARTVVTATKSGYKSAVNVMPTAGRLAIKLGKGASWASLAYAALQALPDLKDVDSLKANYPAGTVEYSDPTYKYTTYAGLTDKNINALAAQLLAYVASGDDVKSKTIRSVTENSICLEIIRNSGTFKPCYGVQRSIDTSVPQYKSIPISGLAPRVLANAAAGHAPSKDATRETAIEMVVSGDFDADLLAGAVPINDSKPLVPSVPISGNGNTAIGDNSGDMSGASPGEQADAAKDAADKAKKAAQAAADAAKAAAEQAAKDAADAQDLINSAADQAAIDAANDRAAAAEQAAADAKAVSDAAVAAANDRARAAEQAAAAATESAKAAAAKAAADVAAAKAAGDAAAVAAAEAAKAAADSAVAEAQAKQAAAEKAAEKAKAEAAKPFELPAFCSWAAIVCETAEWLKREPETPEITAIDTDSPIDDFDSDKSYITFTGGCPPKYTASLNVMGATAPFEFDYTPICTVMSYLKPFIVGAGYIAAAYIIAGHSRGSKD